MTWLKTLFISFLILIGLRSKPIPLIPPLPPVPPVVSHISKVKLGATSIPVTEVSSKVPDFFYYNIYRSKLDSSKMRVATDKKGFQSPPLIDGYDWIQGGANEDNWKLPTLNDNEYYIDATSTVRIKIPNYPEQTIPESDIINGAVSSSALTQ